MSKASAAPQKTEAWSGWRGRVVVVAGPTASGKSALATRVAETFGGVVINADSMQVYRSLRIVTARPAPEDEARVPHRLYGVMAPVESCSAGRWLTLAAQEIEIAWAGGRLPVVTGGTGLYLKVLMEGLSPMPHVPQAIRTKANALYAHLGPMAFHAEVAKRDPAAARRLPPTDRQRLVRAYEMVEATGRPLSQWQVENRPRPPLAAKFSTLVLMPGREALNAACDGRFLTMMEQGALDEVRALLALGLDPGQSVLKALGVPELSAHLRGETSLDEAVAAAQRSTRNFAKRQITWFRHQLRDAHVWNEQFSERLEQKIFPFIRQFLLTEDS